MSKKFTIKDVKLFVEETGDGDKLLSDIYIDCHHKINILCGKCGNIYKIRYNNYKEGHRCFNCSHKEIWNHHAKKNVTSDINFGKCFPDLSFDWDYEKNEFPPEYYSLYSNYYAYWICPKCKNKYGSTIANRTKMGNGCPLCNDSKMERQVKIFFSENKILYEWQKTFDDCIYKRKLEFDFYVTLYNLIIETQGRQHFVPVDFSGKGQNWASEEFEKNKIRDQIKRNYCQENKIKLLEIPYWNYDKIEEILVYELNL